MPVGVRWPIVRVVIAGGGTGGHLFPGIALGQTLLARGGAEVLFVGSARGLEARVVPEAGFPLLTVGVRQIRGGGVGRVLAGGFAALAAVLTALRALRRFRADVVVGTGGYVSVPVVVAAWIARVPVLLLEQNVIPGATTRVLGRLARCVCVSFPETATSFPGVRVVCTGNPVRPEITSAAETRQRRVARREPGAPTLLVIGGSAGAHRLNLELAGALAHLGERGRKVRVVHQTGDADAAATAARYAELGIHAEVRAFFTDMAPLYAAADLAVCRAGATTIAELLAVGVPAVLIPYPFAADDHQRRNAEAVAAGGAAILVIERELTVARLATEIAGLLDDETRRARMTAAARALARPDAARLVLEQCEALAAARTVC
jgi:UDP-N-acetylglucosamine--N-acetylmuramyl-(pentapeptide) pyrophosphoryl-undecaprenol N-acetylglucosamine transferase